MHDIALFHQQLFGFGAYRFNDRVGEELLLVEPADAFVKVHAGYTARQRIPLHERPATLLSPGVGAYRAGQALLNCRKGMSPQRERTWERCFSGRTSFIQREERKNAGSQHRHESTHQERMDRQC